MSNPTCTRCIEPWTGNDHVCNAMCVAALEAENTRLTRTLDDHLESESAETMRANKAEFERDKLIRATTELVQKNDALAVERDALRAENDELRDQLHARLGGTP